jgi:hypothetical protein
MTQGMESGQGTGAGAAPQSPASPSGDQQSSSTNVSLETVLKRMGDLEAQLRGLQKVKDKGTNKLQKQVKSISEQVGKVQQYIERYGSTEEAARQMALDGLLGEDDSEDDYEPDVPVAKGKAKPKLQASADAEVDHDLLDLIGVDVNDPELVQRVQNGESYLDAAKSIGMSRKSPQQQQVSAAALGPGGAGSKVETTQAALRASYDAEVAKLPRPAPIIQLEEIKRKYRRQGLDVW